MDVDEPLEKVVPVDDASIDAIARRVVELMAGVGARRLVTASELAERLGVERSWIYANARRLGGVRLGDGRRAQLRFDVDRALSALRESEARRDPVRSGRSTRRRRKATVPAGVELLRGRRNKSL